MTDTVGFAFLARISIGIIVGALLISTVYAGIEKKRIKRGMFEDDGVVYRITEIKP